ncbi:hypothetical protein TYRP_006173 [Tyrophagus putrescentiae]|nr:hypothetical protein TYRP_006173 [Tyrophagus putrescentiae]
MYGKVSKSSSASSSSLQNFDLRNITSSSTSPSSSSSSAMGGLKAMHQHLTPLSTYLVLYLFFSAQVFPRSSGAQKFYPNGRYGRRSDLPPLPQMMKVPSSLMASVDAYLANSQANGNSGSKDITAFAGVHPLEDYQPMWCTEVERKLNLFKCFDRFPVKMVHVGQSLPEMKSIAAAVGGDSSSSQGLGNVGPSASDVDQS